MNPTTEPSPSSFRLIFSDKRMFTVFLLGFSSGLPIAVVYGSVKLWLQRVGIDIQTIGYFSWTSIFYGINFLWAFLFDHYRPFPLGRRRSWLMITQIGLMASFLLLSQADPQKSVAIVALLTGLLCFWSASQDLAVDAYRNEILAPQELGLGASIGVYGYRLAMWLSSGFGIWAIDQETLNWSFNQMFLFMALCMGVGLVATLWADEPKAHHGIPSLKESVVSPFVDFWQRPGPLLTLLFIFFYKFGDSFAGSMSRPFYAELGFSNKDIGQVASTLGLFSTLLGLFVGGGLILKWGIFRPLWISGIFQAISTAFFAFLASHPTIGIFSLVVFLEDFSSGMGTSALVTFIGNLTNKRFTAAQFALLASVAFLGRTLFSGFAGDFIGFFGYPFFYFTGALLAVPGLMALWCLKRRNLL